MHSPHFLLLSALLPVLARLTSAQLDFYAVTYYEYDGTATDIDPLAPCSCSEDILAGCYVRDRHYAIQGQCMVGEYSTVLETNPDGDALCIEVYNGSCQASNMIDKCSGGGFPFDQCPEDRSVERYSHQCIDNGPRDEFVVPLLVAKVFKTQEECEQADIPAEERIVFDCRSLCFASSDKSGTDKYASPASIQAYCEGDTHKTFVYTEDSNCGVPSKQSQSLSFTLERRSNVCTKEGDSYVLVDCSDVRYYCKKSFDFATILEGPCDSSAINDEKISRTSSPTEAPTADDAASSRPDSASVGSKVHVAAVVLFNILAVAHWLALV